MCPHWNVGGSLAIDNLAGANGLEEETDGMCAEDDPGEQRRANHKDLWVTRELDQSSEEAVDRGGNQDGGDQKKYVLDEVRPFIDWETG